MVRFCQYPDCTNTAVLLIAGKDGTKGVEVCRDHGSIIKKLYEKAGYSPKVSSL